MRSTCQWTHALPSIDEIVNKVEIEKHRRRFIFWPRWLNGIVPDLEIFFVTRPRWQEAKLRGNPVVRDKGYKVVRALGAVGKVEARLRHQVLRPRRDFIPNRNELSA
jgi:hypothetical protein